MEIPKSFLGYKRENGRVGTRNHVIILPVDDISNACAEAVANNIKGTIALPHSYGRLQFGADLDLHFRTMIGTGKNPNVAAVIVIGIEPKWTKRVVDSIAKTGDMLGDAASGGVSGAAGAGGSEMEGASGEGSGEGVDLLGDEIRAAQDALKEAGIALQEAGQAIQTATTEEELERAEDLLSDARVAVIIAEGDLIGAKEAVLGNGGEMTPELEAVFESAENSLGKATGVLAEASTVVLTTRQAGLPELATDQASSGRLGDLEDDLDDSLGVFDGKIGDARSTVLNGAPPTTSGLPAQRTRPGASNGQQGGEGGQNQSDAQSEGQRGSASAGAQVASAKNGGGGNVPENIPDGQDDDIVAQQLREAAMSESDPELQAKLWEEYARYKSGG